MAVFTREYSIQTRGDSYQCFNITRQVTEALEQRGLRAGIAVVFVAGSTAGITTIEFEPGAVGDLGEMFERLAPVGINYLHEEAWHDGNGHSHVRAALLGASLTVPFTQGGLILGTWQQIVLIDFDNKPRNRKYIVQILGE